MNGYVYIHRRILEWGWYKCPETLAVFIHLLLNARFAPGEWKGIPISAGQLITGRKTISEQTGVSERAVRTAITRLISTNEITIKTTNRFTLITIANWDKYQHPQEQNDQQNDQQNDPPTTNKRPTNDHYVIREEGNKGKKTNMAHDDLFETFWKAYPKKEAKQAAIKAWKKLNVTEVLFSSMLTAIKYQDIKWAKEDHKYTPLPATWLNNKRWEDETPGAAVKTAEMPKERTET